MIKLEMNGISDCIKGYSFLVLISFLFLILYSGPTKPKSSLISPIRINPINTSEPTEIRYGNILFLLIFVLKENKLMLSIYD